MSDYVSIVFYKGQQRAPVIFPVQSWHEAALRQGHAALSSKNFSEKWSCLCIFPYRKGENFLGFPLSLQAYASCLCSHVKSQGSTPMPLLK